jgi:hypothetical protein
MYKTVSPSNTVTAANSFDIRFSAPVYDGTGGNPVLSSTAFSINGVSCYIGDAPIVNSDLRQVFIYKITNNANVVLQNIGTLNCASGELQISGFLPDTATPIQITATPQSNDLAPILNQLLEIDISQVTVSGEIDSIAVAGSAGSVGYTTPSRS